LGESKRVQYSSRLQSRIFAQLDHHLHAQRIFALLVPIRQTKLLIELPAHRSHWAVADHRERRTHIHSGQKVRTGIPMQIGSLIREPNSDYRIIFDHRRRHWRSRPQLHYSRTHQLLADPLVELTEPENQSVVLLHERRDIRQLQPLMPHRKQVAKGSDQLVRHSQCTRAIAGSGGIEKINELLRFDRSCHWNRLRVEIGKALSNPARTRY